jgi:hypothetical protein
MILLLSLQKFVNWLYNSESYVSSGKNNVTHHPWYCGVCNHKYVYRLVLARVGVSLVSAFGFSLFLMMIAYFVSIVRKRFKRKKM